MDAEVAALFDLGGRVAVVSGAATGIGGGIARLLARAGAFIVVADFDISGARRVAGEIGGSAVEIDYERGRHAPE